MSTQSTAAQTPSTLPMMQLATLIGEDGSEIAMTLENDSTGDRTCWRWYADGEDTEVSGRSRREAIENAMSAWSAPTWDLQWRFEGWRIRTAFLDGNLMDGWETEGIDEAATIDRYVETLQETLQDTFPHAEIEINHEGGSGCVPRNLGDGAIAPDNIEEALRWRLEESVDQLVDEIVGQHYQDSEAWVMPTGASDDQ